MNKQKQKSIDLKSKVYELIFVKKLNNKQVGLELGIHPKSVARIKRKIS